MPFQKGNPGGPGVPKKHSEDKRKLAVAVWLTTRNLAETSYAVKVPRQTIQHWRMEDWWKRAEDELKNEGLERVKARMSKIVGSAMDILEDRLADGDYQLDQKTGEVRRIPVSSKSAIRITSDLVRAQAVLEKQKTQQAIRESTEAHLKTLAKEFQRFSQAKDITPEIAAAPEEEDPCSGTDLC